MKKDNIFFGESGLTSTSANFIANQAKEAYRGLEYKLKYIRFYNEEVTTLHSSTVRSLKKGVSNVEFIQSYMERIASLKSLISWLREAIKAKERLTKEIATSTYSDYGLEEPEKVVREETITEDDIVSTWNIKKRNRFYYVWALSATYGDFIHEDGAIANARAKLNDVIDTPSYMSSDDLNAALHIYTPSVTPEAVDSKYMELQQKYREYQAELNSYKHEITTAIDADDVAKSAKYHRLCKERDALQATVEAQLELAKKQKLQEIQALKIVIPDDLKRIYDEVSRMGKKS